jgi:hypothetical protein
VEGVTYVCHLVYLSIIEDLVCEIFYGVWRVDFIMFLILIL